MRNINNYIIEIKKNIERQKIAIKNNQYYNPYKVDAKALKSDWEKIIGSY